VCDFLLFIIFYFNYHISPQFIFCDFANVCINCVHLFVVEIICSLYFSFVSRVIPKCLMLLASCGSLEFRYTLTSVISFLSFSWLA